MIDAFIGLGSNLDNPEQQLVQALAALSHLPDSQLIASSSLYLTKPMGPADQPNYVNAVAQLRTHLSPQYLLQQLQFIECQHGRIRNGERWGARTLDLDILLYGNQVIESASLTVPHYGMRQRNFVLYPLAEIAPALSLPDGTLLSTLLQQVAYDDMIQLPKQPLADNDTFAIAG